MDDFVGAMTRLFDGAPAWLNAIIGVVAAASAVTALTPSPKDDRVLGLLRRILEMLALNIGHARPGVRQKER